MPKSLAHYLACARGGTLTRNLAQWLKDHEQGLTSTDKAEDRAMVVRTSSYDDDWHEGSISDCPTEPVDSHSGPPGL